MQHTDLIQTLYRLDTHTPQRTEHNTTLHNMHTERTHTTKDTEQNTEQHTENNNTEHTIQNTENSTSSAHNYRTYSLDYYNEYAYIKNSNTIELYTISKD